MLAMKITEEQTPMGTFAERLKRARRAAGLSQRAIAKHIGITQAAYSHMETGLSVSSRRLPQIAKLLGVDANWLATGKGDPGVDGEIMRGLETLNESNKKLVLQTIRALQPSGPDKD